MFGDAELELNFGMAQWEKTTLAIKPKSFDLRYDSWPHIQKGRDLFHRDELLTSTVGDSHLKANFACES
jgi:hypothetical protein